LLEILFFYQIFPYLKGLSVKKKVLLTDESEEEGSRQTTVSRRTTKARATVIILYIFSPQNENLNLLVRIKFLNLFLNIVLNKN
jgi:hypothetical protein